MEITISTLTGLLATSLMGLILIVTGFLLWHDQLQDIIRVRNRRWLAGILCAFGVYFLLLAFTSRTLPFMSRDQIALYHRLFLFVIGLNWLAWLTLSARRQIVFE